MAANLNVNAFITGEFRAAALLAQQALLDLRHDKLIEARENIRKARNAFMAGLVHLRDRRSSSAAARADADRLDDALREVERRLEEAWVRPERPKRAASKC